MFHLYKERTKIKAGCNKVDKNKIKSVFLHKNKNNRKDKCLMYKNKI